MEKVIEFVKSKWKWILGAIVMVVVLSYVYPPVKKALGAEPTKEQCDKNPKTAGCPSKK